jgi:hypothetical protein
MNEALRAAMEVNKFFYGKMQWCGCGEPNGAMELLGEVLEVLAWKFDLKTEIWESFYARYSDKLEQLVRYKTDYRLACTYFYILESAELTEHGGSVPGWLTDEGEELLKNIHLSKGIDWDSDEVREAIEKQEQAQ